jgi:TonB family protein
LLRGLAVFVLVALACGEEASEYQVKAAYIYNFAKSAEWPQQVFSGTAAPLVIGVLGGSDEFAEVLKDMVAGKTIGSHPVAVKHITIGDDLTCCQMIFFRATEQKNTRTAIAALHGYSVLLVGEYPGFLPEGGMINLVSDKGRIRFEVARDALDRSEIHFSPKFLSLAIADYGSSAQQDEGSRQLRVKIAPEYPAIAREMKLQGAVQVEILVERDGRVKDVRVLGGHPLLADALVRAVKQWKYEPAARDSTEIVKYSFGPDF